MGIPVVIAGAFVSLLMRRADIKWVKTALWILRLICILIGDVGCAIGIYFIFRHVSSPAARDFLITALVCWLALGLLDMAVSRFGRQK